jgi:hypothetical protein
MHRSLLRFAFASVLISPLAQSVKAAEPCTKDTMRRVIDEAGARLRVVTAETQPRIMAALRKLKEKRGWTGAEGDEKAGAFMSDERTAELDSQAATLLARIDELSETGGTATPDCSRLTELEATSLELQAAVKAKAQYILSRLEHEAGGAGESQIANAQAPAQAPTQPKSAKPATPAPKQTVEKGQKGPAQDAKPKLDPGLAGARAPEAPLRRADEGATPHRRADAMPMPKEAP